MNKGVCALVALGVIAVLAVPGPTSAAGVYEWEPIAQPGGGEVYNLRADGAGTLYVDGAGLGSGVTFASTDEGMTWRPSTFDSSALYQHDSHGDWYQLLPDGIDLRGHLLRSSDRGATWQLLKTVHGRHFFGAVYVSNDDLYLHSEAGLFHSPDRGTTWLEPILPAPDRFTSVMDALLIEGSTLTVLSRQGVMRSTDRGQTWTTLYDEWLFGGRQLARHDGDLYAVGGGALWPEPGPSLFRSTDDGTTWTTVLHGARDPSITSILPTDHGLYATTSTAGVWRSLDGVTWTRRDSGFPLRVEELAASDGAVYTRTAVSEDRGVTWRDISPSYPAPTRAAVSGVENIGVGRRRYRVDASRVLLASDDAGASWRRAHDPSTDKRWQLYHLSVSGQRHALLTSRGLFRSDDAGESVTYIGGGPIRWPSGVESLQWVGDELLAGAPGGVWVSQDGGATWKALRAIPGGPTPHAFLRVGGRLWSATSGGVVSLAPRGARWDDLGLPPDAYLGLFRHDAVVYTYTTRLLYRTHDGGASWHATDAGLPADIVSIAADGGSIYAATESGLYRMTAPPAVSAPPTLEVLSEPYRYLAPGATAAGISVRIAGHEGPWQWRVDAPFPSDGPAGGVEVRGADRAVVGLAPGRLHRIYATLTTDAGEVAYPSTQRYVTVFAPRSDWHYDQDLGRTRIAYWTPTGLRTVLPTGGVLSEVPLDMQGSLYDGPPSWAPDGARVVAGLVGGLAVLNVLDGSVQPFASASNSGRAPVWSPDGARIAFLSHAPPRAQYSFHAATMPVGGGPVTRVGTTPTSYSLPVAWTADGSGVSYVDSSEERVLLAPWTAGHRRGSTSLHFPRSRPTGHASPTSAMATCT